MGSMQRYRRVEENLDEYETDGDEYEDMEEDEYGEAEEEADVEEEDPESKRKVHEYLELRQKLKDEARKKLAKQSGSVSNARDSKRAKLDNFGSFFGPSRPVIAERVIQESKSFLETRPELPRVSSSQKDSRKAPVAGTSAPKNGMSERRLHNPVKNKVQKLKDTRDYSFLLSDDVELPKPANVPRSANLPPSRNSGTVSVQVPSKSRESGHAGRHLPNGAREKRPAAANSYIRPEHSSLQKPTNSIRPDSRRPERLAVPEQKKHYPVSGHGNGTGRPLVVSKEAPSKMPLVKKQPFHLERKVAGESTERKAPPTSIVKKPAVATAKVAMPNGQRTHLLKSHSLGPRQPTEARSTEGYRGKILPKQSSSSLKPKINAPKQIPPRYNSREEDLYRSRPQTKPKPKPKPKPVRRHTDDDDAILEIRKLTGYNPSAYVSDGYDSSDMEADFSTIQAEEKRSSRIAREEDEREQRLIEEEEEKARRRRLAKRKMEQR